jgi:hypothetical protein
MALKPDRVESQVDISFFMNTSETRGGVATLSTGGSGVAMDDSAAVVSYAATASGKVPMGVLLNDVVDIDLTRQHINYHKDEVSVGSKVALLRAGQVTTNSIDGTPTAGDKAYVGVSGLITDTAAAGAYQVGTFLSSKDADNYAKVSINIV